MTPQIAGYIKHGKDVAEISYGSGIFSNWIVGVTFNTDKLENACCSSFDDVREALEQMS